MTIGIKTVFNSNKHYDSLIVDKESSLEVLSRIFEIISSKNLASFHLDLNKQKINVDFEYDFSSCVFELKDLENFLNEMDGKFCLYLYEMNMKINFTFLEGATSDLNIIVSKEEEVTCNYTIDSNSLYDQVLDLLDDFEKLVSHFFPKSYKRFLDENYLFIKE